MSARRKHYNVSASGRRKIDGYIQLASIARRRRRGRGPGNIYSWGGK